MSRVDAPLKPPIRPVRRAAAQQPKATQTPTQAAFSALPCAAALHRKILEDIPLSEIARWLQEDQHVLSSYSREGLTRALYRYRGSVPVDQRQALSPQEASAFFRSEHARLEEKTRKVDELTELGRLYEIQLERVLRETETERRVQKSLATTGQEIKLAAEILKTRAGMKVALGIGRAPDPDEVPLRPPPPAPALPAGAEGGDAGGSSVKLSVEYRESSVALEKVRHNAESRRKVLSMSQRLLALAAGEKGERFASLLRTDGEALDALVPADGAAQAQVLRAVRERQELPLDVAPEPEDDLGMDDDTDAVGDDT